MVLAGAQRVASLMPPSLSGGVPPPEMAPKSECFLDRFCDAFRHPKRAQMPPRIKSTTNCLTTLGVLGFRHDFGPLYLNLAPVLRVSYSQGQ